MVWHKPSEWENWTRQEKIRYRQRQLMRQRAGVKNPYVDDEKTGLPLCVRKAGGWDNYIKLLETKKATEKKPREMCECGASVSGGWMKWHLNSAGHAYKLKVLENKSTCPSVATP